MMPNLLLRQSVITVISLLLHSRPTFAAQTSNATQAQTSNAEFRIAGTVVNGAIGVPLARVRVSIAEIRDPQNTQWMITGDDGHFEFRQVKPGKYSVQGAKRGFVTAMYDQHEEFSTAIVTGSGLDTENLVLRLSPTAVLTGKVTDESGAPVRHASVALYREDSSADVSRILLFRSASTDDQGTYEFILLDPGTYFLSVKATPWYAVHPLSFRAQDTGNLVGAVDGSLDAVYPITYYYNAREPDDATPIPVRGGDRLEVDVHLSPVPALHLLFRLPDNTQGVAVPVLQRRTLDGADSVSNDAMQMVSPSVYEISGVPGGMYTVRMVGLTPGQRAISNEIEITRNGQELDVSSGKSTSTVIASVELLGEATLPPHFGLALRNSKMRVVAWQSVNSNREVEFQNIAPGKYEVLVGAAGRRYSVVRISSENRQTSGRILNVAPGSFVKASLSLVAGAVNVEGFVKRAEKPAAGVMVVLVPKDDRETNRELFRRDQSDLDGSFNLLSVIPGSYMLCAIENGWDLDWAHPTVIAHSCQHGQALVVGDRAEGFMRLQDAVQVQPR